jgi:RND superfamily putative drug exporter
VQVYIAGDQGETLANDSVDAVTRIATERPAPPGVKAYVTGPAASSNDQHHVGDASMQTIEMVTFGVIAMMLVLVYRSVITTLIVLTMVVLELSGARGVVASATTVFGLTTFATNMLVTLAIAAATDYGIF